LTAIHRNLRGVEVMQSEYICQSCGMPIDKPEDLGTNSDLTKSEDYCIFCFHNGIFSEPEISKAEMVSRITQAMIEKTDLPKEQAHILVDQTVSSLKRWQ